MFIHVETSTGIMKRKILNFQIAGDEIFVNYKIGSIKTIKKTGPTVTTAIKATVQSDIIKLKSSERVTVIKDDDVIYSYEKKKKES